MSTSDDRACILSEDASITSTTLFSSARVDLKVLLDTGFTAVSTKTATTMSAPMLWARLEGRLAFSPPSTYNFLSIMTGRKMVGTQLLAKTASGKLPVANTVV